MSFRIETVTAGPLEADDWPLPERSPFLKSSDLNRLVYDLRRYSQGEISGRSYLISGHRGAGKTAVALWAIEDLRYELLQSALQLTAPRGTRRRGLQRPLLVKLHGPSLVEAAKGSPEVPQGASPGATSVVVAVTPPGALADPPAPAGTIGAAHSVLVQITIALYRQLSIEAAHGYAIKARRRRSADSEELGAQLLLELDSGADPAVLRSYWSRIGRLSEGVFWPLQTDEVLANEELFGQGMKELLALATASQAFQVCTGRVTQTFNDTKSLVHEAQVKAAGASDMKELVGRLSALGVGAVGGAAFLSQGMPVAVAVAALVWLLGTATVSWTVSATRKRDREDSYSFLPTKDVQNLDRDLPVVIQRVRDAGLAPVFVIDELDKLKEPGKTIAEIIDRLKHIIADFGFFCFLTDRSYFDEVKRAIDDGAYPSEHTYFSERRLLVYTPDEFVGYFNDILVAEGDSSAADGSAQLLLALHVTHRSMLNFVDANRELASLRDGGVLRRSSQEITRDRWLRLNATVQVAIDLVLSQPALIARTLDDHAFAQALYDALYDVSRKWVKGESAYDAARAKLKACLEERACGGESRTAAWTLPEEDFDDILDARTQLISYLRHFDRLRKDLAADPRLASRAELVAREEPKGLLADSASSVLSFLFDRAGYPKGAGEVSLDATEVDGLAALLKSFIGLLADIGATPADLVVAQLLPRTLAGNLLEQALVDLNAWSNGMLSGEALQPSLTSARELASLLDQQGERVAAGVVLARRLSTLCAGKANEADALSAIARYPVFGPAASGASWKIERWKADFQSFGDLGSFPALDSTAQKIENFRQVLASRSRTETAPAEAAMLEAVWNAWKNRFLRLFEGSPPPITSFGLEDLASAAMKIGPSAELRADFASMTVGEWSLFALGALVGQVTRSRPRWALVAGLRVLRFDGELLMDLATDIGPSPNSPIDSDSQAEAVRMASGAPAGRKGLLVLVANPLEISDAIPSSGPAQLYVPASETSKYDLGLDWLASLDAFEGQADELRPT